MSDSLKTHLTSTLTRFQPYRAQRYAAINVLLLTWADSDFDNTDEVDRLGCVFREQFQYFVWRYHIPSKNAQTQLTLRVVQFPDNFGNDEGNLILIYYGGHGGPSKGTDCIWSA